MRKTRATPPLPPPPAPRPSPAAVVRAGLTVLLGLLLPWLGSGLVLDELPAPATFAGRLGLALLLLVLLALHPRPPARRDPAAWLLVALAVFGAVSLLLPRAGPWVDAGGGVTATTRLPADLEAGLQELARLGIVLLAALVGGRVRPAWLLGGLTAGSAWLGARGLQEFLTQARAGDSSWRIFVGFGNPNQLAALLLVLVPVGLAAVALAGDDSGPARWLARQQVARPGLKLRLLLAAGCALAVLALGLTRSRGALAALLLGLLVALAALAGSGHKRLAGRLLAVVGVLALGLALGPLHHRLAAGEALAHSNNFRVLTWRGTLDLARHFPLLGCGLGGWPLAYPLYARAGFTQHAHNGYLQVLAEGGLGALAAYLALFGAWLWSGWRAALDDHPQRRALGLALVAATVGFAVHNFVDFGWYVTAAPLALALLGGATLATEAGEPRPPAAWERPALAVGGAVLAAFLTLSWAAESDRAAAKDAALEGLSSTAVEACRAALAKVPWSALAEEDLAGVLASRGDLDSALAAYRVALARRPTSARIHYRLAATLADAGRLDQAVREASLSAALSPMHLQGRLQLGKLLEQAGRPAEARAEYARLDQLAGLPALTDADPLKEYLFNPVRGHALVRLADLARAAGDLAVARDAYQRAIPEFERYLVTWREAVGAMAGLEPDEQRRLLALRGLRATDQVAIERLQTHSRQSLTELGEQREGLARHR